MSLAPDMTSARAIADSLDLDTAIRLLSGRDFWSTEGLPEHGLEPTLMTDGPHGLRKQDTSVDNIGMGASVPATCFPTASLLAATWDDVLVERVGEALGREARAEGISLVLGPGMNLKRHPAGGRNFEYFSEDPLITGHLAAALARGIQSQGVGACLKHYAVNNQESNRFRVDTIVDERTERELYLRSFGIAIQHSKPWAVMSSYNRVNGEHVGESVWHVREVLRGQFGFDGMLVSDWFAVNDRVEGVRAGLDLEMPSSNGTYDGDIRKAVSNGTLEESHVREAAARVIAFMQRARAEREAVAVDAPDLEAHNSLAREAATRGAVLLSNNGILPLASTAGLVVIGGFAASPRYQGAGSSLVNAVRVTSVLDAFAERGIDVTFVQGYNPATGEVTAEQLRDAVAAATGAQTVLLMVGLPDTSETEGLDRDTLRMPPGMESLVDAVCGANDRTVVTISAGAPIETPWADAPAAILLTYLGGQASGAALVDVIVGDADPSGRLAESWPVSVTDLPAHKGFANHPTQVEHRETQWVGYRFHETWGVPARFPFGHGLGYADFDFGAAKASSAKGELSVSLPVTNTSERDGFAVVQVYAHLEGSVVQRPDHVLAGWTTVAIPAGAKQSVKVVLDPTALEVWDNAAQAWVLEGGSWELRIGASSTDIRRKASLKITSDDTFAPRSKAVTSRTSGPVATQAEFIALLGTDIPQPKPLRPFHLESTVADLTATRFGRFVRGLIVKRSAQEMGADLDDVNKATAAAYADGMPLRGLAMAAGISRGTVKKLVKLLNILP